MQKQHCCSLERTLALLWALWISMAAVTNISELLVKLEYLSNTWMLKSGNLAYLMDMTKAYQFSPTSQYIAFGTLSALQCLIALTFWRAVFSRERKGLCCAYMMVLWLAGFFILADEVFLQGPALHVGMVQHMVLLSTVLLSKFTCGSSKCEA